MRRRWITSLLATICLLPLVAACGSADTDEPKGATDSGTPAAVAASPTSEPPATPAPAAPISSTSIADLTTLDWQLAEIDGAAIIPTSIVTLNLAQRDDNLIQGYGNCYSYLAGIVWDATSFRISDSGPFAGIDQSERVCQNPDGGAEQDAAFFAALSAATSYVASDEQLVLHDAGGQPRLTFVPQPVVTVDPALTGPPWRLTSLIDVSPLPGTTITLAFDPDGAGGNDGCNEYGGGFLVASDGRLTFAGGYQTEMACLTPEGVMEQADRYAQALAQVASYRVDGDQLHLIDHSGAAILRFMREDAAGFDPALAAQRWGLVEVNGQPTIPGSLVTLELADGGITGSDGCNFFGSELAVASNGAFDVTTPGFTQTTAGCRWPGFLAQAERVTALLRDATWYAIDGDRLTIGDTESNQLVFGPQAEVLLIGSSWNVPMLYTELPDGEVRGNALVEGTEITLTFATENKIHGSAGCHTYSGSYTLDGASITISIPLATTTMDCPVSPGVMEQEATYLDTLRTVTIWEIGMNGLTLTTDDGRELKELTLVQE